MLNQWQHETPAWQDDYGSKAGTWLTQVPRISAQMRQLSDTFAVRLLKQCPDTLSVDEINYIGALATSECTTRQVFLLGDAVVWSYGRVLIPNHTYEYLDAKIENLGENPIGETLLYNHDNVERSEFEYLASCSGHQLYDAIAGFYEETMPTVIYARRSKFTIDTYPLVVIDVILPNIPDVSHHAAN